MAANRLSTLSFVIFWTAGTRIGVDTTENTLETVSWGILLSSLELSNFSILHPPLKKSSDDKLSATSISEYKIPVLFVSLIKQTFNYYFDSTNGGMIFILPPLLPLSSSLEIGLNLSSNQHLLKNESVLEVWHAFCKTCSTEGWEQNLVLVLGGLEHT